MTRAAASFTPTAYVAICRDGANGPAVRRAATAAHLAYIESVLGELHIAGPLYDPAGTQMIASIYSFNTTSLERARQIIEHDPYFLGGAFESVEYFPHLPAAGQYIGGKIW